LPDGTSALCFDSGETFLPLQQTPQIRFSLFDRAHSPLSQQANEICLVRNLPTPAPGALEWGGEEKVRHIRATVVVYL